MNVIQRLQPTNWLAERLNLSVATIERLRAQKSPDLPPHIVIGRSIRYEEAAVEQWLRERMQPQASPKDPPAQPAGSTDHE